MPGRVGDNRNREGPPPPIYTCRRRRSCHVSEKATPSYPWRNFAIATQVSENVRKRAECVARRAEVRSLWMRLMYPAPEDSFGPTGGFIEDAIVLATLGFTYLELAEVARNSAARQHIHREMTRQRGVRSIHLFTNHREERGDAYAAYRRQLLDSHPAEDRRRMPVCAGFPPYCAQCQKNVSSDCA